MGEQIHFQLVWKIDNTIIQIRILPSMLWMRILGDIHGIVSRGYYGIKIVGLAINQK